MNITYSAKKKPKKKNQKKANKILALILVLVVLGVVFVVLAKTVLFPIKKINVTTNSLYTKENIIEASGLKINDKMFGFSGGNVERAIIKKLPYIKSVSFNKTINGVLTINATKDTAEFCIENAGKYIYLNNNYKILEESENFNNSVLLTKGITFKKVTLGDTLTTDDPTKFDLFKEIYTNLNSALKNKEITLNSIDVSNTADIKAVIKGGITVNFGSAIDINYKINHLIGMLEKLTDKTRGVIDLSGWSRSNTKAFFKED